jgi:hypothetical protein
MAQRPHPLDQRPTTGQNGSITPQCVITSRREHPAVTSDPQRVRTRSRR